MSLSDRVRVVSVRFSEAEYRRYSSIAADKQQSLSTYLRTRLDASEDALLAELADLRRALEAREVAPAAAPKSAAQPPALETAALAISAEALLLLRSLTNPANVKMVHKELERLGLKVWR